MESHVDSGDDYQDMIGVEESEDWAYNILFRDEGFIYDGDGSDGQSTGNVETNKDNVELDDDLEVGGEDNTFMEKESCMDTLMNSMDDGCDEGYNYDSESESFGSNVVYSPGGKTKLYRPTVAEAYKPNDDMVFKTIDDAIYMYRNYAEQAGFDVRLNTTARFKKDKSLKHKWVLCNRSGKIPDKSVDTLDEDGGRTTRNSNFRITECQAKIKFERVCITTTDFKIRAFVELHNHPLYNLEERRHSKRKRKLNYADKELIVRASSVNVGPTKAHKLKSALKGGYDYVGPEVSDYKIFRKRMGNIIGNKDAQLVVNKMEERIRDYPNYTFKYKCVDSVLNAMFWADEIDKVHYKEFGDVISFDATFRTNKYGMIFVPFTAIDNHSRSITVGAGLISSETIESYKWLLKAFLKAHGKAPKLVLTDQDPALIQAIDAVFVDSKHRLCMWHIMKKLQFKLKSDLMHTTDFRKRFSKLVWSVYLEPDVFEERWNILIDDYKLGDKRWFKDMYEIRKSWIPAFFKDMPMHGLMKTTSRSESANSFFNKYAHYGNYLVYFMYNFDTAIGKQRNTQQRLDTNTKNAKHRFTMKTGLEVHASKVYTTAIFEMVLKEIKRGIYDCTIDSVVTNNGVQAVLITHMDKRNEVKQKCQVQLNIKELDVICSCGHFIRTGILCRHAFAVLRNNRIEAIPEKYIVRRWRKDIISSHLFLKKHGILESDESDFKMLSEAYSNIEYAMERVKGDKDKLVAFVEMTRNMKKLADEVCNNGVQADKNEDAVLRMLGVRNTDQVEIQVPKAIRNKGRGTKARLKSASETGAGTSKSSSRICSGCNRYLNHNWRTCPVRLAKEAAKKDVGEVGE